MVDVTRRARKMPSGDIVKPAALGAMLGGALWLALGIVSAMNASGRDVGVLGSGPANDILYALALAGTLAGIMGLHARQAVGYGWFGAVGFFVSFAGVALLIVGLMLSALLSIVFGGLGFFDWVLGVGLWGVIIGLLLLGAATLWLGALPRWCGLVLVFCVPLAIAVGDYGGGAVLGVSWILIGYTLFSQRDVSALLRPGER